MISFLSSFFSEFWEDHFKCRYPGGLSTPHNQGYRQVCTGEERLTRENTQFEAQLQFVSDAVMAFAHAFRFVLLSLFFLFLCHCCYCCLLVCLWCICYKHNRLRDIKYKKILHYKGSLENI